MKRDRGRISNRWPQLLQAYESDHAIGGEIDADHEVQRKLKQIFLERHENAIKKEPSLEMIPRFYRRRGAVVAQHQLQQQQQQQQQQQLQQQSPEEEDDSNAQRLVRKLARSMFLQRKSSEMLFSEEYLNQIYEVLNSHHSPPFLDKDGSKSGRINYDDFCMVREELVGNSSQPEHLEVFFDADTFAKFRRDDWGRISIQMFFQYLYRHVTLYQAFVQLSVYDTYGDGYLREQNLENYIYELIPSLEALNDLQENFYPFYVFTAVRKFFFFLDPKHTCKIAIKDLVISPIFHELLHLHNYGNLDEGGREDIEAFNWFSAQNTLRVYSQYLELDIDHNGMLSRSEIAGYGTGSLTTALIDRVFEECLTYEGEMDYKTFLDFVLAMGTKKSPQSLAYFFRLLDIKKVGYLDRFTINYFFREIVQKLHELDGGNIVRVEDVTDEIFDMCKPSDPTQITLQDLINCKVGDTIVTMLIDLSGFWAYDNREQIIAEEAREEQQHIHQQQQDTIHDEDDDDDRAETSSI